MINTGIFCPDASIIAVSALLIRYVGHGHEVLLEVEYQCNNNA